MSAIGQLTFAIGCGAGFDAHLMATTPRDWKQRIGKAAYFVQAIKLAATIDVVPYRFTVDGEVFETDERNNDRASAVPMVIEQPPPSEPS